MHYTKTMKQKIIKEYQELKDESVDDFVKRKGIGKSTLYKWQNEYKQSNNNATLVDVTEVIKTTTSCIELLVNKLVIKLETTIMNIYY